MQFNPSDKSQSIIADIDFLLFGDGSTFNSVYSLVDRTRNVNIAWDEAVSELYKADPNHKWDDNTNADFPIATLNLTANQDHYTLLDSALVIHRVRMADNNGVMRTLEPVSRRQLSDTDLNTPGSPSRYYKIGDAIFPTPIPDYSSADGVELEFQRGANHFTTSDTDTSPGFNPQFHHFLSVGASLRYALANDMDSKINQLRADKETIRNQIMHHYQMRSPDQRPQFRLKKKPIRSYGL